MDKLIAMKIKYDDGTYSDEIPISVLAENVQWDSSHTLVDVLGNVNLGSGSVQDQITYLFNNKISNADMQAYVNNSMPTIITNWLDANVTPVGSAVVVDESLTIDGAAADAKITGDEIADVKSNLDNVGYIEDSVNFYTGIYTGGKNLNADGTMTDRTDRAVTEIFNINENKNYYFKYGVHQVLITCTRINEYNANGNIINSQINQNHYIPTEGTKRVQMCLALPYMDMLMVSDSNTTGSASYVPYSPPEYHLDIEEDFAILSSNVEYISDEYNKFEYVNNNLFNLEDAIQSKAFDRSNGLVTGNSDRWITGIINYTDQIIFCNKAWEYIACYDSTDVYLGYITYNNSFASVCPKYIYSTTAKIRMQFLKAVVPYNEANVVIIVSTKKALVNNGTDFGWIDKDIDYKLGYNRQYNYSGEKIRLKKHSVSVDRLFTVGSPQITPNDGDEFDGILFQTYQNGLCRLFDISTGEQLNEFTLDQSKGSPHCNTAQFGSKYLNADTYPLFYVNAYSSLLPRGACYVHRIISDDDVLSSEIVQTITIGFTDTAPWYNDSDTKPYANFAIDKENGFLYAYLMKESTNTTRFFKFLLPNPESGDVTLLQTDILDQFDMPYYPYIQSNAVFDGLLFLTTGVSIAYNAIPYIRVINPITHEEVSTINLVNCGIDLEPESIFIYNESIYVTTNYGNDYVFRFIV